MSRNTPAPVALTAAMLMSHTKPIAWYYDAVRLDGTPAGRVYTDTPGTLGLRTPLCAIDPSTAYTVANLASAIHRLAPACRKLAEAQCNGEWHDGQRDTIARRGDCYGLSMTQRFLDLDKSIADYATRLDRRIAKLNAELAPFGGQLIRSSDPRGACLSMAETPVNDYSATHYAIG